MFSAMHNNSVTLDVEPYRNDPAVYELACVIRDEVNAMLPLEEAARPPTTNALFAALTGQALHKPWHYHLTDIGLLKRTSARLGCSMRETVKRIRRELSPPNWEALFWLEAYMEAIADGAKAEVAFALRESEARRQARSELARQNGGKAHRDSRANKQYVFNWLDENRSRFKSMNEAAAEIVKIRLVQGTHNTIYGYVREYEKLRSAGKP